MVEKPSGFDWPPKSDPSSRGPLHPDEPSIGLHPPDNQRLIDSLKTLRDVGNTVIVVEHDEDMMRQADHLTDIEARG